jgi:uncharacterized glyoxalase superfamily protein PhnB
MAFYRDVLGFEVRRAEPLEAPTFASLQRGENALMLSPFDEAFEDWRMVALVKERRGSAGAVSFYIEAGDDISAESRRAEAAGAVVDPLAERPWGQREFTVADPDGFWWAVWKSM